MYNELKKDSIIVELKSLIENADKFKDDLDMYCEFMHDRILAVSGIN